MMNIEGMTPAERRKGFLAAWAEHKRAGFADTQAEADKTAAEWGIEAPKIKVRTRPDRPAPYSMFKDQKGF